MKKTFELMTDEEFESICNRCGACCGAFDGDPCEELRQDENGHYYCAVYETRLGKHYTLAGLEMDCVSIIKKLKYTWVGDEKCAYKKMIKSGKL
ncbi:MAG: hypothetical protein ACLFQM_08890 [Fidelibacterota bacterium]